ncbi:hypothetical protein GJAV_G00029080 [Gymnothorax javanicus]|nr:hypothetical protein GJAV_G00029080 [Gymnothorax javanicus]
MQSEFERGVSSLVMRGRRTDHKTFVGDQVCSVVTASPRDQRNRFWTSQLTDKFLIDQQMSNYDDCSFSQWSSESEGERGLNAFQRKMRREHQQALASVNKACIIVERNRRKRITVSCSELRQLLPQVNGARSDMVTVLEMTVAFLEYINQATLGYPLRERLFPPDELCCWWLSENCHRNE